MTEKDDNKNGGQTPSEKITFFIIAAACTVLGAVAFGVSFAGLGVYSLISSMILELAAVSFLNAQKKTGKYFKLCIAVRIVSYAIMIAGLAFVLLIIVYKV